MVKCLRKKRSSAAEPSSRLKSAISAGLKGSFSQEEYVELHLYKEECSRMMLDGICASEGRDVPYAVFVDFSGLSLTDLMGFLDYGKAMIQLKSGKYK